MYTSSGLLAAFIALLCWGFGDFFMQRSIRAIGKIEALFFITVFGVIILFPFIQGEMVIFLVESQSALLLFVAGALSFISAYMQFRALEKGKLAAVEPAMSLELPATIMIGVFLLREHLTVWQLVLIAGVFIGVLVTSIHRHHQHWWGRHKSRKVVLEAGVLMAGFGAIAMAGTNIMTGLASRGSSPLITIWFIHTFLAIISFVWLWLAGSLPTLLRDFRTYARVIIAVAVFDTAAWIAYSFAVLTLPIALTIGITESYVALAAFLGLRFNHEKFERHQIVGGLIAIGCSIALGIISQSI
jgi:drug/metabolite transporter (DMT)-like permease